MVRKTLPLFLSLLLGLIPYPLMAQSAPSLEKIRVVYSAIGGSQSAVWIPYEAGIFRKHGLEVELLYVGGGGRAAQVVQSGEVPIGTFTGAAVVNSNLAGGDLVIVAGQMDVLPFFLAVRPEIRRPEDLKGKKIGITRFGSATDFALLYAEQKWPVKRGKDFAVIQIGGMPEMLAALKGGALDAATLNAEFTILARKEGFTELAKLSELGLEYLQTCVTTTRTVLKTREDLLRRFVLAFVEGIHFYKTNKQASVASIGKFMKLTDTQALEESYTTYAMTLTPRVPLPTLKGVQTILDDLTDRDPRARGARPEQFVEPRLLRELQESGVIDRLYRGGS